MALNMLLLIPFSPTVDPSNPYQLTAEEEQVMAHLVSAFTSCEKLQRHIRFFLEKGSLYKIENNILMFHACVPLNEDGSLKEVNIFGTTYKGRALFDAVDHYVRAAFVETDPCAKKTRARSAVVSMARRRFSSVCQEQNGDV